MRTPSGPLLLAAFSFMAVGCVSKPAEDPEMTSRNDACASASDPVHLVSTSSDPKPKADPEIESLLTQRTDDEHLAQINRRMYQSLHALDVELRREQRIAACEQPSFAQSSVASTQSNNPVGGAEKTPAAGDGGGAVGGGAVGPASASASASTTASTPQQKPLVGIAGGSNFGQTGAGRKATTLSPRTGGGNGARAANVAPGNDNDIVARRLRKAAEQETNATLRAKLWKEYTDYLQGTSAK